MHDVQLSYQTFLPFLVLLFLVLLFLLCHSMIHFINSALRTCTFHIFSKVLELSFKQSSIANWRSRRISFVTLSCTFGSTCVCDINMFPFTVQFDTPKWYSHYTKKEPALPRYQLFSMLSCNLFKNL